MRDLLLDRRAQPEYNFIRDPLGQNASTMWSTFGGGSGGGTPVTLTSVSSTLLGGFAGRVTAASGATSANAELSPMRGYQVQPDARGRLGLLMWMRASTARPAGAGYIRFRGTGYDGVVRLDQPIGTNWTLVRATATNLPSDRTYGATYKEDSGGSFAAGEWIEATRARLVQGDAPLIYSGPDTPGWKSLASGGSVGWPYTLDSIAKPDYDLSDPSKSVTVELAAVPALQGRSFYVVPEVVAQVANGNPLLRYGNAAGLDDNAGTFLPRQDNLNTTPNINLRISSGGTANGPGGLIGSPIIGMHAGSVVIPDGFASFRHLVDSVGGPGSTATSAQFQSGGMPQSLITYSNTNGPTAQGRRLTRALFYQREHSTTTQRAIMRWLANRYGIPVGGAA